METAPRMEGHRQTVWPTTLGVLTMVMMALVMNDGNDQRNGRRCGKDRRPHVPGGFAVHR